MSLVKDGQKSVRVVLPSSMYEKLKQECPDHGDMSKLIRNLLRRHLKALESSSEVNTKNLDIRG